MTVVAVGAVSDGTPIGQLLGYDRGVCPLAVAIGTLADDTQVIVIVIVSSGRDGTVRVWRLADSTPVGPPLNLPELVQAVAVHGIVIVTAAKADIAVRQRSRSPSLTAVLFAIAGPG